MREANEAWGFIEYTCVRRDDDLRGLEKESG